MEEAARERAEAARRIQADEATQREAAQPS